MRAEICRGVWIVAAPARLIRHPVGEPGVIALARHQPSRARFLVPDHQLLD